MVPDDRLVLENNFSEPGRILESYFESSVFVVYTEVQSMVDMLDVVL